MSAITIDPATVACSYCGVSAGQPCVRFADWGPSPLPPARKPHKVRERDALAVAAHADAALDAYWPRRPCGICGTPNLPSRHRVVDAIASLLEAGEIPEEISAEMDVTHESIYAVQEWMAKWPGAWR